MPWSPDRWPPARWNPLDADLVFNEVRSALAERDALVPAGYVADVFSRWDPVLGTPCGGEIEPLPTVANFQYDIQQMLTMTWPLRWWDAGRQDLYTLTNLCQDAFGRPGWTWDLTAVNGQGRPANRWTPPYALLFEELYAAINRLDSVRILPTVSESWRRDSVHRMTWGIEDWPAEREATLAMFDGTDDGQLVGLAFDVGLGGEVFDDGFSQQWVLESRMFSMKFATATLAGCIVRRAWLDFSTAPSQGEADFSDTFTAEVVDGSQQVVGAFDSDDYGPKHFEVSAGSIRTDGDTEFAVRSTRADSADRPAWAPAGPNYTSTYREGLAMSGPVRLVVEVNLEFHG